MTIFELLTLPRDLQEWRMEAHKHFDKLWKTGIWSRTQAYIWMQKVLNLPAHEAHIKKLNEYQLRKLIKEAKDAFSKNSTKRN